MVFPTQGTDGGNAPKIQGRLTPNPLKHIDPIGFLMIFLIHFGWGKPVQIDPSYYKKPYRDELITALAGPASNILLGIAGILIMLIYGKISHQAIGAMLNVPDLVSQFWILFSSINFGLAAFNLIPLPPLDGYRLVKIISSRTGKWMERNMRYIAIGFLVLVVFGPFSDALGSYISWVTSGLFKMFAFPLSQIFY
ncbi:MAG: site-2 protease family protein [candidate division SR1 bacterium]|nr:MAG: site-2 protease family protein [candidate division SR1 bacterium]